MEHGSLHFLDDQLAVLEEPLHQVALPYAQGLGQDAGECDGELPGGVLLDTDLVGHWTWYIPWLLLY